MILTWRSPFRLARAMWHAAIYVWHGKPVIAPARIIAFREAKCQPCKYRDHGQCRLCTCFISIKTSLSSESCPDGRWGKVFTSPPKES